MSRAGRCIGGLAAAALLACDTTPAAPATSDSASGLADVTAVSVARDSFSVTIQSPDAGCGQYADWWEVITPGGELRYRRVLGHSHTTEQPFTRSGGPVPVQPGEEVIVRAHMNPGGYGGAAMRGSVDDGFAPAEVSADLAPALAQQEPLPTSCLF